MIINKELVNKIEAEYGLPCYVFDEEAFRANYLDLYGALRREYSKYEIAYSYKTNYAPKLCSVVREMGGYAEVVSDMEYSIAKKVGYDNKKIVYNGPFKGDLLEEHLLNDGIVNIDNMTEVDRIIEFAKAHPAQTFRLGIRVNINVGQSFISRFGIDADSPDLKEAAEKLAACENTALVGLHCHIGQARGIEAWRQRTTQILELADRYIEGVPEYLDLGSGMFGKMSPEMLEQFTCDVPSYEDYASVTAKLVNEHYKDVCEEKKPILFTEPGTTVDNRYIDLIAKVDSIKRLKGKDFAVLNCSVHNLGDVALSVKLPLTVLNNHPDTAKTYEQMDFVGYTCLERDVPYKNYCGKLSKGDIVIFGNVGGYSNVDKPPFILPQCAMIGIRDEECYVIKRKETVEDILSTYIM